ncbi:hypothetical protein [Paenibacillus sp. BJ-4]|uniref:hypothetical protein n=1 Tax=Paenibacillus sp. BJ-4 TaxID=2878097 RepID=UPI001CF07203|nr:hypothetical protein [Paenibacillus sp. BJ-4]
MLATFSAALQVKKRMAKRVLKLSGVHGIGVGYKDPAHPKKGAAVIVYTDRLASASTGLLSATALGKKTNVPVRIVKTGKIRANATDYRARIRPVVAGYSVGTIEGSGTTGLIVAPTGAPATRYLFSNNHVLNPSNTDNREATIQPGGADGGTVTQDRIGRLYRYVRLNPSGTNLIDTALSLPTSNSLLSPRYATVGAVPGHVTAYRVGERFKKVGRTTGRVNGTVESVYTDLQINYGGSLGLLTFEDQTVIRGTTPVSLPGDSGSVWLRQSDNYAAAVNYAGTADGRLSIAFPVQWFMQVFNTRVARPNGAGRVLTVDTGSSPRSYTRQLTSEELARLRPRTTRIRKS